MVVQKSNGAPDPAAIPIDVPEGCPLRPDFAEVPTQVDCPPPERTLRLSGELDLDTQSELRAQLREVMDLRAPAVVSLDMADVTFIDCSALAPLVEARGRLGNRLLLHNASRPVARLLTLVGLSDLFVAHADASQESPAV